MSKVLGQKKVSVPVYDERGKLLGTVSPQATSVAASKIAGTQVEFSKRFGNFAWVAKSPGVGRV